MDTALPAEGHVTTYLETAADRVVEGKVIERLTRHHAGTLTFHPFPTLSACDYITINSEGRVNSFVEIKSRANSPEDIEKFGGLLLKHRKVVELHELGALLNTPVEVVFAFDAGDGVLMRASVDDLIYKPLRSTGRRDRGLATDEEPVVLLNWPHWEDPDLTVIPA